jgi:hypothetical protein
MSLVTWLASRLNRIARGKTSGRGRPCSARDQQARLHCELLEIRLAPAAIANPALTLPDPLNATADQFGAAVAVSATDVLVGASGSNEGIGVAYLYGTSGLLLETYQQPPKVAGHGFGEAVALSGSNVAVAAAVGSNGGGSVYVFTTVPGFSTFTKPIQTFLDPDASAGDEFGASVAMWGDYVLVGAPGDGSGAAFLYTTYSPTALLKYTHVGGSYFAFGESVAGSDSNVLVGARGGAQGDTGGAAFLYSTPPPGSQDPLSPLQVFADPNASAGDGFGQSVAVSGDDVLVGAYGVNNNAGTAYLYNTTFGPAVRQTYGDPNHSPGDFFGESVALFGDSVLVGAGGTSPSGNGNNLGAAYRFSTSGSQLETYQDPGANPQGHFGSSVALSGNNVLIGAYGTASTSIGQAGPNAGTVYRYEVASTPTALPPPPSGLAAVLRNDPKVPLDLAPFANPYISGVAIQIEWTDIEMADPATGAQPDWTRLDELFAAADQAHKWVHLLIIPGFFAPPWVLKHGSGVVTDPFPVPYGNSDGQNDQGQIKPLPMPYDPVYLADWFTFLNQLSERYASNPEFLMIGVAGPTSVSEEFTLPSFPKDILQWVAHFKHDGFTSTKYIQAWQQAFDAYAEDFPNQYLSLSHGNGAALDADGNAVQGKDAIDSFLAYERQAIVDEGLNTLGDQFVFQSSALNGVPGSKNQEAQQMVTGYNGVCVTGYLLATTCENAPDAMGAPGNPALALALTIDNGLEQNTNGKTADYIEIHATDVDAVDLQPVLRWGAARFDSAAGGDYLGLAEAVFGNDVLVGDPSADDGAGAAYLYSLSGQLLQTFGDPGQTTGDDFGAAVALSGTNVLVGAYGTDDGTGAGAGAVYLFSKSGGAPIATLTDPTATAADYFGYSVAMSGGNVLVGAIGANRGTGAAYLFKLSSPTTLFQTFTDPNPLPTDITTGQPTPPVDNFATSVAVSSSYVLVGAYGTNNSPNAETNTPPEYYVASAAYLFSIASTAGTSGEDAAETYLDPHAAGGNFFAYSVALSDSNVLVGAYGSNRQQGAAYLFSTSGGPSAETYTDADAADGNRFGFSLALSGSNVLIGAYGATPFTGNAASNRGTAYLFDTSGQMLQSFEDPSANPQDVFGHAVALAGSYVLVGEFGAEPSSTTIPGPFSDAAVLYQTASSLSAVAGNNQSAVVETAFSTPLEVRVTDSSGNPVSGADVTFTSVSALPQPGGSFVGANTVTVVTNSQGLAFAPELTANTSAGSFTVTATLGSLSTNFALTNLSGAPASISAVAGDAQNTPVRTTFGTSLEALVTDSDNNPVANVPVSFTFAPPVAEATGTFNGLTTVLTNDQGLATAPPLTANRHVGVFTVNAAVAGSAAPASFLLTNTAVPATIKRIGGAKQSAVVNSTFAKSPMVRVKDSSGKPVIGITVDFEARDGAASAASGTFAANSSVTDSKGVAIAPELTANTVAGVWYVNAWVAGIATPVVFTLTNVAGSAAVVEALAGTMRATTIHGRSRKLEVQVTDEYGNVIHGAPVTFAVQADAGNSAGTGFVSETTRTATTSDVGLAVALLKVNARRGTFTVTATVPGVAEIVVFQVTVD